MILNFVKKSKEKLNKQEMWLMRIFINIISYMRLFQISNNSNNIHI